MEVVYTSATSGNRSNFKNQISLFLHKTIHNIT